MYEPRCDIEGQYDNVIKSSITQEEVRDICRPLKMGKAAGSDFLQYEHFKYAGYQAYFALASLFNCIIKLEYIPISFRKSINIPLFKGGDKDNMDRNNFRGISLQSIICKIYDSVVLHRTKEIIFRCLGICSYQAACRKGLSSLHAGYILSEMVTHSIENRSRVIVTYFDTRKAFDTLWIEGLFYKLYNHGITGKLWRILRNTYKGCIANVRVCGSYTDYFEVHIGVKQGALFSMLYYICYVNELLVEMNRSGLGVEIMGSKCAAVAYADDIAVFSLHPVCMQRLINMAVKYSHKWHFRFNPTKCAMLCFGETEATRNERLLHNDLTFTLDGEQLQEKEEYSHVGIVNRVRNSTPIEWIMKNISNARRAFYCTIGTSLYKTQLSPLSLAKVYSSVCISRLLYGAEIRYFSDHEIVTYEQFHRDMAKDIQMLPKNTPNPVPLATLGWQKIIYLIDLAKLRFGYSILSGSADSIFRIIFVKKLCYILSTNIFTDTSPVAQFVDVCCKYRLLEKVKSWIVSGTFPGKIEWRKCCKQAAYDHEVARWRLDIRLYKKLNNFRVVQVHIEASAWWILARYNLNLKRQCSTMLRLLAGCSQLRAYKDVNVPYDSRLCTLCDQGQVETLYHMVMCCEHYEDIRTDMMNRIYGNILPEHQETLQALNGDLFFYILMGLEFPISDGGLWSIRYISCQGINKMYRRRVTV